MSRIRRVVNFDAPEPPPGRWSNCLTVDGVAYVSGMTARAKDSGDIEGDEYDQAKLILDKIIKLVQSAGGDASDIVKLTVFVTDIAQRELVWRARAECFTGDFPTSTLVQVAALADPRMKVEIDAIAHIGASRR